ncbi:hypothetical protein [Bacillus sp. AFS040349]|uniref:hypothetical protein n=1 Tax=Bacillus sp. AFS040349 TaxID=2033502 RepID=UPI000BFB5965|nr:hypothetical protein [Bacillus sp. AFS040349]PGT83270.1 hypothetical protein COD11_13120 [Bacillus sp. AFS040349]
MKLQLVVNNKNKNKKQDMPTCRKNCELFDPITEQCGVNYKINPDDPLLTARCGEMIYKDENDDSVYIPNADNRSIKYTLIEDEFECELEDESMFLEFHGDKFNPITSTYPMKPDYQVNRDDAIWYVSPSGDWGCWIINKSKKRFFTIPSSSEVIKGWTKNVYMSPYPLHDHNSSLSLASRMAWFVDADGYGQYVLIANGKISMIASPKPVNWTNQ